MHLLLFLRLHGPEYSGVELNGPHPHTQRLGSFGYLLHHLWLELGVVDVLLYLLQQATSAKYEAYGENSQV